MISWNRHAKINLKVLMILLVVTVGLGSALLAARQIRRDILSKRDLAAGEAAFAEQDWSTAYKHLKEYLGRNPDDIEILKKYAKGRLILRGQRCQTPLGCAADQAHAKRVDRPQT